MIQTSASTIQDDRVVLLLEIIADELYCARVDREHAMGTPTEHPQTSWLTGARQAFIEQIEEMRDRVEYLGSD